MSKKRSNPLILRLGIKTKWVSKYFEKKSQDLKFLVYESLQIEQFIKIFLLKFGLELVHLEFYYKKKSLILFLAYAINLTKFQEVIQKKKLKFKKLVLKKKLIKVYKKSYALNLRNRYKIKLKFLKKEKNIYNFLNNFFIKKSKIVKSYKNTQRFLNYFVKQKSVNKSSRLYFIKFYFLLKKENKFFFIDRFIKKIFITLNNFLNKKINITLITKQLNKTAVLCKQQKINLTFNVLSLKKFEKINNFNLTINLFYALSNDKTKIGLLISNFISNQLSKIKNPKFFNFFFKFAINAIKHLLLFSKKLKGLVIEIKGNLSKNPRAIKKTISLGNSISKSTLNCNLEYNESICFSKKGTIGVKTWINY